MLNEVSVDIYAGLESLWLVCERHNVPHENMFDFVLLCLRIKNTRCFRRFTWS